MQTDPRKLTRRAGKAPRLSANERDQTETARAPMKILIMTALMIGMAVCVVTNLAAHKSDRLVCPSVEEEIVDLEMLTMALRKTRTISVFKKIGLKLDIDALLARLHAYHDGASIFSLEELEEQYNVLLMKIAAHLQHKDVGLHRQLCNAWDVIWRDLQDPTLFRAAHQ